MFSFFYRGNGYGYFDTEEDARKAAKEKRQADSSAYVHKFGRPSAVLYRGDQDNLEAVRIGWEPE